jgi:hypothetical protein
MSIETDSETEETVADIIVDAINTVDESFDGSGLADEIMDGVIRVLQRAYPRTSIAHWEAILADSRAELARKLSSELDGLINSDTLIETVQMLEALEADARKGVGP